MISNILIGLATVAAFGLASGAYGQGPAEGDEAMHEHEHAEGHSAVRDAHREAMHQQMQVIQKIEDPDERKRQMEALHEAMRVMRAAMMGANDSSCAGANGNCQHENGMHNRHGQEETTP